MPVENYQIVTGVVIAILILLLAGFFIMILITYSNKRKKVFLQEKHLLEVAFNDQLLKSQLEMQEQTFNSISHEIHDNVGQVLSLAKVQLNIMDQSDKLDRHLLAEAKENVSKAMTDLRDIAKSLNTDRIQSANLQEITTQELQRINRSGLMSITVSSAGAVQNVQEQKKLIIFRMIQESLQNIIKHSKAKNIDVSFNYEKGFLKIQIADNGIGFDKELPMQKDGLGLQNIFRRASLIGGEATVNSSPQQGTTITIISPYD